jgi:hypothetical protein
MRINIKIIIKRVALFKKYQISNYQANNQDLLGCKIYPTTA